MKGLSLTEQELNKPSELESKYTLHKQLNNDSTFGDAKLLKHKVSDEVLILKEKTYNSKEQFAQAIMDTRERIRLNHKSMIEVKDYSTRQKNDFCSTFYILRIFYEFQMNNVQKEFKYRKDKNQEFSMIELTHLLYNITEAGCHLQENSRVHGDIRPSHIAVLEEAKRYKLIDRPDPSITPMQAQFNYMIGGKDIYLPPQLYANLKKNNLKETYDQYKSDVFSLGLVILELGLKKNPTTLYEGNQMNEAELNRWIQEFSKKFEDNPLLFTSVTNMLLTDEKKRPDFIGIRNAIPPYAEILEFFDGEDEYYNENDDYTQSSNYQSQPGEDTPQNYRAHPIGAENPELHDQFHPSNQTRFPTVMSNPPANQFVNYNNQPEYEPQYQQNQNYEPEMIAPQYIPY
jgi:hypothetical protein